MTNDINDIMSRVTGFGDRSKIHELYPDWRNHCCPNCNEKGCFSLYIRLDRLHEFSCDECSWKGEAFAPEVRTLETSFKMCRELSFPNSGWNASIYDKYNIRVESFVQDCGYGKKHSKHKEDVIAAAKYTVSKLYNSEVRKRGGPYTILAFYVPWKIKIKTEIIS